MKRKILSVILALVMALSVGAMAFADPTDPAISSEELYEKTLEEEEVHQRMREIAEKASQRPMLRGMGAPSNGEHIYGSYYFPEEYSSGYINLSMSSGENAVGVGSGEAWWGDPAWVGRNNSKNNGIYIDYYSGAYMDGKPLDVRTYVWTKTSGAKWEIQKLDRSNPWGGYMGNDEDASGDRSLTREFHFYQAGHCGDPNYEVTFKGVLCACDLDGDSDGGSREYVQFDSGMRDAWLASTTSVQKRNGNTWWGTEGTDEALDSGKLWVTIYSSPSAPLQLTYGGTNGCYGAGIDYIGARINYVISPDGQYPLPSGAAGAMGNNHGSALYGTYRYSSAPAYDGYTFDGWYYDAGRTSRANATDVIVGDRTVYGTYHRSLFTVTTSVVNGSITPSNTRVQAFSNYTVSYSPNNGYLLTSVKIDGSPVNITSYPDGYTFGNIQADHSVEVVYAAPSASKSWAKEG